MTDRFKHHSRSLTSPIEQGTAITPSDNQDLAIMPRALYVGQSGHLAIRFEDGSDVVLANVQAGTLLPVRVARVRETGTTAGSLVGLW